MPAIRGLSVNTAPSIVVAPPFPRALNWLPIRLGSFTPSGTRNQPLGSGTGVTDCSYLPGRSARSFCHGLVRMRDVLHGALSPQVDRPTSKLDSFQIRNAVARGFAEAGSGPSCIRQEGRGPVIAP